MRQSIDEYFATIYPLLPVVHEPSFRRDFASSRLDNDKVFFSLVMCVCVVGPVLLPRRFLEYKKYPKEFDHDSPGDLARRCERIVLSLRDVEYSEQPTNEKCAIAYLLAFFCGNTGFVGKARVYWGELGGYLNSMRASSPSSYKGLGHIEAQVRKKLFWLLFVVVM